MITLHAVFLRRAVANELARLNIEHGEENAPLGGWRNRAIENVAAREKMNPYALDRIVRAAS